MMEEAGDGCNHTKDRDSIEGDNHKDVVMRNDHRK